MATKKKLGKKPVNIQRAIRSTAWGLSSIGQCGEPVGEDSKPASELARSRGHEAVPRHSTRDADLQACTCKPAAKQRMLIIRAVRNGDSECASSAADEARAYIEGTALLIERLRARRVEIDELIARLESSCACKPDCTAAVRSHRPSTRMIDAPSEPICQAPKPE